MVAKIIRYERESRLPALAGRDDIIVAMIAGSVNFFLR